MNNFVGGFIRWIDDIFSKGGAIIIPKGINLWSKGLFRLSPQKFEHYQDPIARQSYCVPIRSSSGVAQEAIGHPAVRTYLAARSAARKGLLIGLPPSSKDQQGLKVMEESVRKDTTAQELIGELAKKL